MAFQMLSSSLQIVEQPFGKLFSEKKFFRSFWGNKKEHSQNVLWKTLVSIIMKEISLDVLIYEENKLKDEIWKL